jgi:hypothetical protein
MAEKPSSSRVEIFRFWWFTIQLSQSECELHLARPAVRQRRKLRHFSLGIRHARAHKALDVAQGRQAGATRHWSPFHTKGDGRIVGAAHALAASATRAESSDQHESTPWLSMTKPSKP